MQVSNSQEELLQWYTQNAKNNPNIIHATERCAAGIIQAIGNFCLGPNVSPRDISDSQKCKVDIFSPGHEVVKFYLFYERWRRAEVVTSEQYVQNLKSVFVSVICDLVVVLLILWKLHSVFKHCCTPSILDCQEPFRSPSSAKC